MSNTPKLGKSRQPAFVPFVKTFGVSRTINSQTITAREYDENGNVLFATGTVTITDGGTGYAKGCKYIKTDVGAGTSGFYENVGTTTACNFDLIGSGGAGVTTFVALSDTPANFTGSSLKLTRVNVGETALEFVEPTATVLTSLTEGNVIVGDVSNVGSLLDASGDGKIMVGNGTTITSVAVSGDCTLANTGAMTVTDLTIASEAQGDILRRNAASWGRISASGDGYILVGDGTDVNSVAVSGDVALTNAGVTTVTGLTMAGEAQGDIIYRNAADWVVLPASTSGYVLTTQGAGSNPVWAAVSAGSADKLNNLFTLEGGAFDPVTTITAQTGSAAALTIPDLAGTAQEWVFSAATQTLTNKTLTAPAITGGTAIELTGLSVRDTGAAFDVIISSTSTGIAADRTLTLDMEDADKTVRLGGDVTLLGSFVQTGDFNFAYTLSNNTDVTYPTTGTLATLAGTETMTNKTLTTPVIASFYQDAGLTQLMTVPNTASDTLCAIAATQTLTNKTLSGNVATGFLYSGGGNAISFQDAVHTVVGRDTTDTLTNKSLDCDGAGNALTNVNADELDPITVATGAYGIPFVVTVANAGVADIDVFSGNAPFKLRVLDSWARNTQAGNAGNWKLQDGATNDLTTTVSYTATDNAITRVTSMDDATDVITAAEELHVINSNAADTSTIYILCIRED